MAKGSLGEAFFRNIKVLGGQRAPGIMQAMLRTLDSGLYTVPKSFRVLSRCASICAAAPSGLIAWPWPDCKPSKPPSALMQLPHRGTEAQACRQAHVCHNARDAQSQNFLPSLP